MPAGRVVSVLEGGYDLTALANSCLAHLERAARTLSRACAAEPVGPEPVSEESPSWTTLPPPAAAPEPAAEAAPGAEVAAA